MMTRDNFLEKYNLLEEYGWQAIDFPKLGADGFYSFMIANNDLPLAWVAITNFIKLEEFKKHFFKRSDPIKTGVRNFQPRLLIVNNGKRWYLADMTMNQFSNCKEEYIWIALRNEIEKIIEYYKSIGKKAASIK